MYSLEEYLTLELLGTKQLKQVENIKLIPEEEELWLYFELKSKINNKPKKKDQAEIDSEETIRYKCTPYKYNVTNSWTNITHLYETYVATDMLRKGYMLITIENGWLVQGGEELYQLEGENCTCPHFTLSKTKKRCKHLILRDWSTTYRSRCNKARLNLA